MTLIKMPFIPEFREAKERNKWIRDNAQYFTVIRRQDRRYERDEVYTFDEAVTLASNRIKRIPDLRFLIYAVAAGHDALVATVSSDGVKEHE